MTTVGLGSPSEEVTDHPQHNISNASIEEDLKVRTEVSIHASSPEIPPLGEPENKRRSWFQRRTKYDADSIATQVRSHAPIVVAHSWSAKSWQEKPSVFDDPAIASQYKPPAEWWAINFALVEQRGRSNVLAGRIHIDLTRPRDGPGVKNEN